MSETESKWEREHPRWPGNTTVYRYYDSWASALEAAGLPPFALHKCRLPLVIEALQRMANTLGRTPVKEEYDGYPSASTVRRRFGSFTAGIRAAGLEPIGHRGKRPTY